MLSYEPGNCSKKQEMTNIVLMEVTATSKCPKDSWYLGVVFLEVLKNELMKEEGERRELSEAKLKNAALRK